MSNFNFTNNWFESIARGVWDNLLPPIEPRKILEVGTYEGAAICYLVDKFPSNELEIHAIDTWAGGIEHISEGIEMSQVEKRFIENTALALVNSTMNISIKAHKGLSTIEMAKLLSDGKESYFDFIYIDASHQAPDVLGDAVLGFHLLRVGGIMGFDDYLWAERLSDGLDHLRCPKIGIDSFVNVFIRKVEIIHNGHQVYVRKLSN